jgi:hypothetical protein
MSVSIVSSLATTQTRYPILVNGILCFSAAEVAAARDFAEPTEDQIGASSATASGKYPRLINGQQVFNDSEAAAARNFTSANRPRNSGTRGTVFDFYA